jgi:hypothetical protein
LDSVATGSRVKKLAARIPTNVWISVLAFGIFAAALAYVMSPMIHAQFSHVDDHEIAVIVGPSEHITLTEIPGKIAQYAIETDGRFRPGYYALRVLEASVAGDHVRVWYLDRFLLALIAGAALLALAYGFITRLPLLVLPLMLIAGPQAEMWTMLGPQETYALPLVLVGLALMRWKHQTAGLALLLAAGLVKESFVLLIPAVVAWLAWQQGRRAWKTILVVGIIGALEAAGVAFETIRYGDFYAQSRTIESTITAVGTMLGQFAVANGWYLAGLLGLAAAIVWRHRGQATLAVGLATAAFVLVVLPQAAFYGGNPPNIAGRYLAPAILFAVLVAGLGYWLLEQTGNSRRWLAASLAVALVSGLLMVPQLRTARATAAAFSYDSQVFQGNINQIEALVQEDPSAWVVLRPTQVLAYYEADFAVVEFLGNRVRHPTHICIEAPPLPANATDLEQRLNVTLQTMSAQGGRGFQALPTRLSPATCIEVDFGQARTDARCTRVVVVGGV